MHLTHHPPLKGLIHAVMLYPELIHVSNIIPNTDRSVCFFVFFCKHTQTVGRWGWE